MEHPAPEPQLDERWVHPLYLRLLHGNFRHWPLREEPSEEHRRFFADFRRCAAEVEPATVTALLRETNWRPRLVGGWFAGLRGWREFTDELGGLLLETRFCFACQGYCVALACFADESSARHLRRYLDEWLPRVDRFYDQHWALPALSWIDRQSGTDHASRYLVPGGLWDQWATAQYRDGPEFFTESRRRFDLTMMSSALALFRQES